MNHARLVVSKRGWDPRRACGRMKYALRAWRSNAGIIPLNPMVLVDPSFGESYVRTAWFREEHVHFGEH